MERIPFSQELWHGVDPATRLPYGVSRHYSALAAIDGFPSQRESTSVEARRDPIAAQYVPTDAELEVRDYEDADPIGDMRYMVLPRLVHRYHDRVLLLVNDRCAVYCRHCFRRHFTGHGAGRLSSAELDEVCRYLEDTPRVREVLLSGGDPLMLPDRELFAVIDRLRGVTRDLLLRVCTRVPVVLPSRITEEFAVGLANRGPAWMVIHANHPRELTSEFVVAVRRVLCTGVPVSNQTVLLRGVNDNADTLEELFSALVRIGVRPYYLFQGDLAAGTAHFRTTIDEGLAIMRTLRSRLSGLALPTYAVDLPDGGGKVAVESALLRTEPAAYVLAGPGGREYRYPRESE